MKTDHEKVRDQSLTHITDHLMIQTADVKEGAVFYKVGTDIQSRGDSGMQ